MVAVTLATVAALATQLAACYRYRASLRALRSRARLAWRVLRHGAERSVELPPYVQRFFADTERFLVAGDVGTYSGTIELTCRRGLVVALHLSEPVADDAPIGRNSGSIVPGIEAMESMLRQPDDDDREVAEALTVLAEAKRT